MSDDDYFQSRSTGNDVVRKFEFKDLTSFNMRALEPLYGRSGGKQCPNCAIRFRDKDKYQAHLDWHFKQNAREHDRRGRSQARAWYLPTQQWHADMGGTAAEVAVSTPFAQEGDATEGEPEPEASTSRVKADPEQPACAVCQEKFAVLWLHDEEEWMYDNALTREDGRIVHADCN